MSRAYLGGSAVAALGLALVATFALASASATAGPVSAPVAMFSEPWASNNTGGVAVVFESPFPEVTLIQNSNTSVAAGLQVDGILELAAGATNHPRAVAVALPLSISHFNGTPPGNSPQPWSFNLTAALDVYPTDLALWNGTPATPPTPLGPPFGQATLTVQYSVASQSDGSGNVHVAWSVHGWPWRSASDVLALESHFSMTPASSLWACSSPSVLTQAACTGNEVPVGGSILWGSGVAGIEEDNASGPTAAMSWSPTLSLGGSVSGSARVTSGLDVVSPGSVEVALGGVGAGASSINGTITLALSSTSTAFPSNVPVVGPLLASPTVYVGSAAAFALFAGVGILWYRRRDAKAREEF